jgi:alkylhydroperoxidase family enzyme
VLGEEVWEAVVDDWRAAPLSAQLKATLAFLEKLTLRPDELTAADVADARAAGVPDRALREAATVCALASVIVRLADSLGWDVPEWELLQRRAPLILEGGYTLGAVLARL